MKVRQASSRFFEAFRGYCLRSSIHGAAYIVEEDVWIVKVFWVSFFLFCFSFFGFLFLGAL